MDSINPGVLSENLNSCLKTRLHLCATRRLPEGDLVEDLSDDIEVEEFAYWWFFTLTAILFSTDDDTATKVFVKTKDVLAEMCQLLIFGHPSIVNKMGVQIIKALMKLLVRFEATLNEYPLTELSLTETDFIRHPNRFEKFYYIIRINRNNDWLLPFYFEAISHLTVRIFFETYVFIASTRRFCSISRNTVNLSRPSLQQF